MEELPTSRPMQLFAMVSFAQYNVSIVPAHCCAPYPTLYYTVSPLHTRVKKVGCKASSSMRTVHQVLIKGL